MSPRQGNCLLTRALSVYPSEAEDWRWCCPQSEFCLSVYQSFLHSCFVLRAGFSLSGSNQTLDPAELKIPDFSSQSIRQSGVIGAEHFDGVAHRVDVDPALGNGHLDMSQVERTVIPAFAPMSISIKACLTIGRNRSAHSSKRSRNVSADGIFLRPRDFLKNESPFLSVMAS